MLYRKSFITGTLASLLLTTNLFAGNCVGGVCHVNLDGLKPRAERVVHAEHIAFRTTKQISAPTATTINTVNMIEEPTLTVIASPIIEEQVAIANSEELSNEVLVTYNDTPRLTEEDQDLVVMIDEVDMENQVLQQSEDYCEETTHLVYNLDADLYECV